MKHVLLAVAVFGLVALAGVRPARAETVDDVIQLAQKGLGEDVLLATVERANGGFVLSAEQVIQLKQAGVSEKVIAAMLRKRPAETPAQAPVVTVAPAAPVQAAPAGLGTLNLENVDDRPWAARLDPGSHILWLSAAGAADERVLAPHGGITLAAPAGAYEVRYAGENTSTPFAILTGEKTLVLVSRVETTEFEGLYVSVFEKGERKAGGRLAVLRQTRSGEPAQPVYRPTLITTVQPQYVAPPVAEPVEPSTTVIYNSGPYYAPYPYVATPYYYRPYPYGPYYNPYGRTGFSTFGHRSGVRIGIGFGF